MERERWKSAVLVLQPCLPGRRNKGRTKDQQLAVNSPLFDPPSLHPLPWPLPPERMLWKAVSTLVESSAEVSMKLRLFFSAKDLASSVGTARRCLRSDLFPTWGDR